MNLIFELTLIITLATILGFIARLLKQPLLVAYLAAGVLLSYLGFFDLFNQESFQLFADLGIMFLLFLVGLEINCASLRLVGKSSVIVGLGQIIFTALIGYVIAKFLGFNPIESAYVAIALTFSSTIIIVKLLSDKKDTHSLYGKISIGVMLVQDIVAIFLLIVLSSLQIGAGSALLPEILLTIAKGLGLFAVVLFLGYKILPRLFDQISHSQELLFLTSTAWVFLLVSLSAKLGFSIEIAGFLAGLALANSSEHFQIANKIRPLRDFFIVIFFILLGSSFILPNLSTIATPLVIFSLFVLIGNPLIVLLIMGISGYRKRTSFLTGVTVAQISEFSLVLAALGFKLGHISSSAVAIIGLSTYMIIYADQIFNFLSPALSIFERKKTSEIPISSELFKKPIVLIGFHRTGKSLAHNLQKESLLIIDFDPDIIENIKTSGYDYLFGDISDPEIFEKAISPKTKLVISTSPDLHDNLGLLEMLNKLKRKPRVIARAETETDARLLYDAGSDYVLLPNLSAGHYLGRALGADFKLNTLNKLKAKDLSVLNLQRNKT